MFVSQYNPQQGSVLDGRYELIDALGQGGMAYVYLARDLQTQRKVALKLMREELTDDPEFIRRFATEARAAASLDHPNIVRVLDYGQDQNVRYIVQEYVEGTTLKELIEEQSGIPWQTAVPLMIQISLALEHAHQRGIIHRDIKPQNVLITPNMIAKVTDFGIARTRNANTITITHGVAFGSVHYFSPEQARGGNVTERSDLYSLGIMLYEMLTGTLPFDGDSSVAVAIKQLQEMPIRPSSIQPRLPKALDNIIFKAIQKSPGSRYQSAREFVNELDAFMRNPNGNYGVIRLGDQDWNSGSTAISLNRGDANFYKVDELEESIRKRQKKRILNGVLIFIILAAAAVGLYYLIHYSIQRMELNQNHQVDSETIVVERYLGRKLEDVQDELKAIYGDRVNLEAVRSETQEIGVIFDQEPSYGTKLAKSEAYIHLKYSIGKEQIAIPEVVGIKEDLAKSRLKAARLQPLLRYERSETEEEGTVLRCSPEEGELIGAGSSVTLWIAKKVDDGTMPDLTGLTWSEAMGEVVRRQMNIEEENLYQDSDGRPVEVPQEHRVILEQSPEAGTAVKPGDAAILKYGADEAYIEEHGGSQGESPGNLSMPNLIGKTADEARSILNSIWPAGAHMYNFSVIGGADINDRSLVVVNQSIKPGEAFDPYRDYVYLDLGKP